jgi:hypothetical protein
MASQRLPERTPCARRAGSVVTAMSRVDSDAGDRQSPARPLHVLFEGLSRAVTFADGSASLLDRVAELARGWPYRALDPRDPDVTDAAIVVRRENGCFRIDAPWLPQPVIERSALRAAANLAVDLIEAYLADRPSALGIHCGAAAFGGRLVLFPSRARAGKSTLMVRLAAGGVPVFTDDVLVLCNGDHDGLSLGMLPRLRLPTPVRAGAPFKSFVRICRGPGDRDYRYVSMPASVAPRHGRTAPVGAVVLLERTQQGPAELRPVSRGDGLQELIAQNLSESVRSPDAVQRLMRLVQGVPCLSLRYAMLDDAFDLLARRFGDWTESAPAPDEMSARTAPAGALRPNNGVAADCAPRYRRDPAVVVHAIDGERFLVRPDSEAVYRLNPVASGLWRLLEHPLAPAEAVSILHGAFPEHDPRQIERDVERLFSDLLARGLLRSATDTPGG